MSPKKVDEKKLSTPSRSLTVAESPSTEWKNLPLQNQVKTIDELQSHVLQSLDLSTDDFGYIEPWHGLKGRQRWLFGDDDLQEMYRLKWKS